MKIINNENIWDTKLNLNIELTKKELQLLFDCVGSATFAELCSNWEMYDTKEDMPYTINEIDCLYDDFVGIAEEYNLFKC